MSRKQVAEALAEIGLLLELKGENPFKARAFDGAARAIDRLEEDLELLVRAGRLTSIPGIGKTTAAQIESLVRTGASPMLEDLRVLFPPGLRALLEIPGLGPKRARAIYETLGIASAADLAGAIRENRLRDLPGFGERSLEKLLRSIEEIVRPDDRFLLPTAWDIASYVMRSRAGAAGGRRLEIGGELRRQMETLREVLVLAEGEPGSAPSEERETTYQGHAFRILTRSPETFEACWLYESCGEEHRASLEAIAAERGFVFDAGGFRRADRGGRRAGGEILPYTEEQIYGALGLDPVHPLLREAAIGPGRALPHGLAGPESVRGVFHVHTTDSDGTATLEQMVAEAERLGYRWIGIADHSQTPVYAHGLSIERLREQQEEVRACRERHPGIGILHGTESDILPDGSLDYPDDLLAELDFVVASIHSQFKMDRESMTRRIERALRHPATTHWGHPVGRILLGRPGYECDVDYLLEVCADRGVAVEFNANPWRLDLDWRRIPRAIELGVPVSVNPDAHNEAELAYARLTVGTAAKGGLTPEMLLNHKDAEEVAAWLSRRRQR